MILSTVRKTVIRRGLVKEGERVLVACSGGPDSMVMLHVLSRLRSELGFGLVVASVDHGLREESPQEVELVGGFAERLALPFIRRGLRLKAGSDVHTRARVARFDALREMASEAQATRIALGHHADDQAETVLSRLFRGSGIRGLAGILPRRDDGVIRPLFDCRRVDIERYLEQHELPAVRDPSNTDPKYERSRLRAELLPMAQREDARVVEHLKQIAEEARDINKMLESMAASCLGDPRITAVSLPVDLLRERPAPLQIAAIRHWLQGTVSGSPSRAHLEAVAKLLVGSGEVWLSDGWVATLHNDEIVLKQGADPKI